MANVKISDIPLASTLNNSETLLGLQSGATVRVPVSSLLRRGEPSYEIGKTDGSGEAAFLDFHSGTVAADYDARIISQTGTGVTGRGSLSIEADTLNIACNMSIGSLVAGTGNTLVVAKNITGGTVARGVWVSAPIMSDVTNSAFGFSSNLTTTAATFTLPILSHFTASQTTLGVGSTVTSQYGFLAQPALFGAVNNYGFVGAISAASNNYNLFMSGSAANYLAGDLRLGKVITPSGTNGARTINTTTGSVNFAAAATSLIVTNSLVNTNSIIIATVATNDSTMKSVQVVAATGSFTIYANAAATAATRVNFLITN